MSPDEVYKIALATTLSFEGGYSDDLDDPGGATMRGVTQKRYDEYRRGLGWPVQAVHDISDFELEAIYRTYWDKIGGDLLATRNPPVALMAFDISVNSGPGKAIAFLLEPMIEQEEMTPEWLFARRMSHYANLRIWDKYGKGWAYRATKVYEKAKELEATG